MKQLLANFLRSEEGFFGKLLGTFLGSKIGGGTGTKIATEIGGMIGDRYDQRKALGEQRAYERGHLKRLAEDARAAGFHPLEALRAGGGAGYVSTGRSPIATNAAMTNSFDKISEILSGEDARRATNEQLKNDLLRVQIDQARRGISGRRPIGSAVGNNIAKTSEVNLDGLEDRPEGVTQSQYGHRDPRYAQDAEDGEAAYGEVGGLVQGVSNLYRDSRYRSMLEQLVKNREYASEDDAHAYFATNPDQIEPTMERLNQEAKAKRGKFREQNKAFREALEYEDPIYGKGAIQQRTLPPPARFTLPINPNR